eukprot:5109020-Prymnesium_polylepis.1
MWTKKLPEEEVPFEPLSEGGVTEPLKIEPELTELDAAGFALLGHPAAPLRKAAMAMLTATRTLFLARKDAYDRAVTEALALDAFL